MRERWTLLLGGAALAAVAAARLFRGHDHRLPECSFLELTGRPCPSCFGHRALAALGGGEFGEALRLNPLVAGAALALVALGAFSAARIAAGRPSRRPGLSRHALLSAAGIGVLLVLANWAYLLIRH